MEPRTDPERHIEDARASLVAHLGELGRRFRAARAQLDVPAHITAHPLAAVGAALALGALLGFRGGSERKHERERDEAAPRSLARAAFAGLVALGVRAAKDVAMRRFADVAQEWWMQRQQAQASAGYAASYNRGRAEPFFDH